MASVIARVELHNASWADYNSLHALMQREGFSRKVRADDNKYYDLPTGTYVHTSVTSTPDGRERAVKAANATGCSSAIVVGGWDGSWNGQNLPASQ